MRLQVFRWIAVAVAVVMAMPAWLVSGVWAQEDDPLAARLGGTRESFEASYGEPVLDEDTGTIYEVSGFGVIFVQYVEDHILFLTLSPERPADLDLSEPHEADWTIVEARAIAITFLPADVELGAEGPAPLGGLAATCHSAALAALYPQEVYDALEDPGESGDCSYRFTTPTEETVALIILSIGIGDLGTAGEQTSTDPCEGVGEWATDTLGRYERVLAIVEELSNLDVDAADAAETLHDWNQELLQVTSDQRMSEPPASVRDVNRLLVGGFQALGLTMELLSFAVATQDTVTVQRAEDAFDAAVDTLNRANDLLEPVAEQCGA